jgi:hypothetical protein
MPTINFPTVAELRALRQLVRSAGEGKALRILGLHRESLARLLAGLGVRAGTIYQVRVSSGIRWSTS